MLKRRLRATLIRGSESHPAVTETLALREITLQTTWHVPPGTRLIVELAMPEGPLRFAALARRSHQPGDLLAGHVAGEVTLELVGSVGPAYQALVEPGASARPQAAPKAEPPKAEPPRATPPAPGATAAPATRGPRNVSEVRKHPRYPMQLLARYEFFVGSFPDLLHESATVVIGRGGCMLETGVRTETVSRRLCVHLVLPAGEEVAVTGSVAWVNPARLGPGGALEQSGTMGVCFDPAEALPDPFLELLARCEREAQASGAAPPRVNDTTEIPVRRAEQAAAEPARPREVALTRAEAFRRKVAADAAARSQTPAPPPAAPAPAAMSAPARTARAAPPSRPAEPAVDVEAMLREYAAEPESTPPARSAEPAPDQAALDALLRDFLGKSASGG